MLPNSFLVALEQVAGADSEDVAEGFEHLGVEALQPPLVAFEAIGGGHGNAPTAVLRHAVGADASLSQQLGDTQSHLHTLQDTAASGYMSTAATASLEHCEHSQYIGYMGETA